MEAFGMSKDSEKEVAERKKAISDATRNAAEVPLKVAEIALESLDIIKAMVEKGNPNSITDAGVGALCARTAVKGAVMNVRVNLQGFEDAEFVKKSLAKAKELETKADEIEREIVAYVNSKISA
jgi:glutamate formiminotransferase/formiminotetrahydrofolate cyclodeaminase